MQGQANNNPLLSTFTGFDGVVPFDKIKTEHFAPALETAIKLTKERIEKIKSVQNPTFENVIEALEISSDEVDAISLIFGNLENANGTEEHRKIAPQIYQILASYGSDISLDETLFQKVKQVHDNPPAKLNLEQKKLSEQTYKSFVRNGALLDAGKKDQLREIDQKLAGLVPEFSQNVLKATNEFELWVTKAVDVEGLPTNVIEEAKQNATNKGKPEQWLFTLQFPSYLPFLTYAKNRDLREKMWLAFGSRAFNTEYDNQNNIRQILDLREKRALLLGFPNHAAFVLEERMAKTPEKVFDFLRDLLEKAKPAAQRDLDEVKQFAIDTDGIKDFKPWDFGYYSEKLREKKYSFNQEELRPYFKLDNVITGVFEHARRLFGLQFEENTQIPRYHEDVKVYTVTEAGSNKYVGIFYADFFPRESKKAGAWMTSYRVQGLTGGKVLRPHISIVCNFSKPTATTPSLLTLDEVKTLFHEFGHALHGMLSDVYYRSLAGTNVFWDFVELPSQIMENWVDEEEAVLLYAKHYETGKALPKDLFQRLQKSLQFQSGWAALRQLSFALLDMAYHTTPAAQIGDVDVFETNATAHTRLMDKIPGTNSSCAFSHIFAGGYSAGYYSYKWAEVLDADAFEYFKEAGLFNADVAAKFKKLLSSGGTSHPMDLYKEFRGREPDAKALLRRDGLVP
ncbi:MAG: M3 family metallopeptidase [Bdellovibrionota bacterium]